MNLPRVGPKGKDIQGLLKNSIALLGRDSDVFKPAVFMTLIKSVRILLWFYVIYAFVVEEAIGTGLFVVFLLMLIAPVISYLLMRYKAITCWMVYEILQGEDTDMPNGVDAINGRGPALFLYAMVDLIITSASSGSQREDRGIWEMLKDLALSIFKEVWDLVKNFSLPAIVIDRASLHEIPKRLRMVKKNVPGALVGILGIDLFGSVIVEMFGVIILPGMFAGGLLGHYGQGFLPGNWLVTLPDSDFTINILPMFFMGLLCSILVSFLNSLVHLVKTSYFTIFYVSLSRPNDIQPALRKEVSHYLNHNDRLEGYDVFR